MKNIYSLVGYSGSGKTTLMEKLIKEIKSRGLRVAVMKHDAHKFEIDHEGKDSYRITQAGADMTLLVSQEKAVIMENRQVDVEKVLSYIHDVDLILTEGYTHGPWKKIGINRTASMKEMRIPVEECFAVMSDVEMNIDKPVFDINDAVSLADFIIQDMKR